MLPNINFTFNDGALSLAPANIDGTSGLITTGVPVSGGLQLDTPYLLTSLQALEDLGVDEAYDIANLTLLWHHCREFFRIKEAKNQTAELYIMVKDPSVPMSDLVDKDLAAGVSDLLNFANGKINLLAVAQIATSPSISAGIEDEVPLAIAKAQLLADERIAEKSPLFVFVEGRNLDALANIGNYPDLKAGTDKNVAVIIAQDKAVANKDAAFAGYAAVGTALGVAAAGQVNHSIAWVGQFNIQSVGLGAFLAPALSNGELIQNIGTGALTTISDLGFIFARTFPNVQGCYFSDSPTATASTSDYSTIENVRVVNKVVRRVYAALLPRLNGPVLLDPASGRIAADVAASFEANCAASTADMLTNEEASRLTYVVDPNQNILSTQKLNIQARILPTGKAREIVVNIGFENPLANQ
jgi:hypothetical protein